MTQETKARMIAYHEEKLDFLDKMITLNKRNENAVKSLLAQYRKQAKFLAELRDRPTED